MRFSLLVATICLVSVCGQFCHPARAGNFQSHYIGQESREIKSLAASDIAALQQGKGWGLAKAAELNGIPGPKHILEMKDEISLTPEQEKQIKDLYESMKQEAVPLGHQLVELEKQLDRDFAGGTVTRESLEEMLTRIAEVHKQLRFTHLYAHLQTPDILSPEQIVLYNRKRGYSVE